MSGRPGRAAKPYARPARLERPSADDRWVHDKAPGFTGLGVSAASKPAAATNGKLLVSNLHYEITPKDLASIFGQIGTLVREPALRYDRSGRSTGIAHITFETPAEATRAKKQFDGILAKGQPMTIVYDTSIPAAVRNTRRASDSLLNRIEKPPLAERLSRDDSSISTSRAAKGGAAASLRKDAGGAGPVRNKGGRGGRGGVKRVPKKPQTAEELDKELDAFMGDDSTENTATAPKEAVEQDVPMA